MKDLYLEYIKSSYSSTIRKQPNLINGQRSEQTPHQGRYVAKVYEKMLNIKVSRKIQIQTMMRYHYTPVGMAKSQNTNNTECW